MVKQCESFGEEYGMLFKSKKSMCIAFPDLPNQRKPDIILAGEKLLWVKKFKHLGNVSSDSDELDEIKLKKGEFISHVNLMIANLEDVSDDVRMRVFQSQCCSFYGSQAWNLGS